MRALQGGGEPVVVMRWCEATVRIVENLRVMGVFMTSDWTIGGGNQGSGHSGQPTGEREYYSNKGVLITNKRVVTENGVTVAVSQINSVLKSEDVAGGQKILFAFLGMIPGALIYVTLLKPVLIENGADSARFPSALLFLVLGMYLGYKLGKNKTTYFFRFNTSSGHVNGFSSQDGTTVDAMVEALNTAIVENSQDSNVHAAPMQSAHSNADELLKYKGLLDAGAISQDEYDAKKRELLGL